MHCFTITQLDIVVVQVEAIRSGVNPGLTLVVGPPGTGKTDVAVQVRFGTTLICPNLTYYSDFIADYFQPVPQFP